MIMNKKAKQNEILDYDEFDTTNFIDPEKPTSFIRFLEDTAHNSQVSIEHSFAGAEKDEEKAWPKLIYNISSSGSFVNFLKFLDKLENSPYLLEVSNLNIKMAKEYSGEIDAAFSLSVFTKEEKEK